MFYVNWVLWTQFNLLLSCYLKWTVFPFFVVNAKWARHEGERVTLIRSGSLTLSNAWEKLHPVASWRFFFGGFHNRISIQCPLTWRYEHTLHFQSRKWGRLLWKRWWRCGNLCWPKGQRPGRSRNRRSRLLVPFESTSLELVLNFNKLSK